MTSGEPSRRCLPDADDARGRGCDIDFQRANLRVIRAYRRDTRARRAWGAGAPLGWGPCGALAASQVHRLRRPTLS